MPPWIEQAREFFCLRVDAGEIWSLVKVTAEAGIGKIAERVSASVLLGYNVLDLKRRQDMGFEEMAVFASPSGSLSDLLLDNLIHPWSLAELSII